MLPYAGAVRAALGPAGVALLVAGGLAYSIGGIIYAMHWPDPYPRCAASAHSSWMPCLPPCALLAQWTARSLIYCFVALAFVTSARTDLASFAGRSAGVAGCPCVLPANEPRHKYIYLPQVVRLP